MDEYIEREAAYREICTDNALSGYEKAYCSELIRNIPSADVAPVRHGRWEDGRCSNCKEEAVSTSLDEPIYDYDWEENLRYSHTETRTEYRLTNCCPNCGAVMEALDA